MKSSYLTDMVLNPSIIRGGKKMRHQRLSQLRMFFLLLLIGMLGMSTIALAKDAIRAGVTIPAGQPVPVITENGTGYTPGTYALGTIILNYTVVAPVFPVGPFAAFRLNLNVYDAGGKQEPAYPVPLALEDLGSPHLTLLPPSSPIPVQGLGWSGSVLVDVIVPPDVAGDASLNVDGAQLVTSLRLSTPGGSFLDTVTNVLVKLTLVHPTACLKVYNFITDATLANMVTSTEVNVNPKGKVTSTNPYGSLSENVLIANICGTAESFDLALFLDSAFSTQPSNNPGNAVFTFSTSGEIDPTTFNIGSFGAGTPQGQSLCLQNVIVLPDTTFFATVHFSINNGMVASALPGGGAGPGTFTGFGASLTGANSGCTGILALATPNLVSTPLTFTLK